ncbi:MAG: ferritin-like domain-containing protein [Chromatiales bacterium]|nr:ferritin-like domain-containing protein [Chromatiales bacterium]MDX9765856.1 ferritin-like domain-containing protein [Ectothiorhodospiraceae bacterium]
MNDSSERPAPRPAEPVSSLFDEAHAALMTPDPASKCRMAIALRARWQQGRVARLDAAAPEVIEKPGRPPRPELVDPLSVPRRRATTPAGRAALIHALAHIEFNAIDLALDAVYRFRALPDAFIDDWLQVAAEEAHHFHLLRERLRAHACDYGDFAAHNGLWEMAVKTAHDPLLRMALVPRVLEARGLDVTPQIMHKLHAVGDDETVAALEIIQRDEVGHVAAGSRWFVYLCRERGLDPRSTFRALLDEHMPGRIKAPLHRAARLLAGFDEEELRELEARAAAEAGGAPGGSTL